MRRRVAMSKRKLDADEPAASAASGGSKPAAAGGTESGQQKPSLAAIFVEAGKSTQGIGSFAGFSGMNESHCVTM